MKKTIIAVALFTAFGAQAASKGQTVHIENFNSERFEAISRSNPASWRSTA